LAGALDSLIHETGKNAPMRKTQMIHAGMEAYENELLTRIPPPVCASTKNLPVRGKRQLMHIVDNITVI
jgi:hypothetical protein